MAVATSTTPGTTTGAASTNPANNTAAPVTAPAVNNFNMLTGAKLAPNQSYNFNGQTITQGTPVNTSNQSTTTLSSQNPASKVPGIQNTQNNLQNNGITTDTNSGVSTYANGNVVNPPTPAQPATSQTGGYYNNLYIAPGGNVPLDANGNPVSLTQTSPDQDNFNALIHNLMSQSDANGANNLANIQSSYNNLIQQQQQANASAEAGTTAYLVGGGRGVSSSDAVLQGTISYGLQQIGNLNAQKQDAINKAQQAIADEDYKYAQSLQDEADKISTTQQTAFDKIQDAINTQNQKLADAKLQSQKDNAIASLLSPTDGSKPLSDPNAILAKLHSEGFDTISLKDITDSINSIATANGTTPADLIAKATLAEKIKSDYITEQGTWSVHDNPDGSQELVNDKTGAIQKLSPGNIVSGTGTPGNTGIPIVDNNTKTTSTGIPYVDGTSLTGKDATAAQNAAASLQIPYIDKTNAPLLDNIETSRTNLTNIVTDLAGLNPSNGWTRPLVTLGHTAEALTQIGPGSPSIDAYNLDKAAYLQTVKSMLGLKTIPRSSVGILMDDLPTPNDTVDVVATKIEKLTNALDAAEKGIFGGAVTDKYSTSTSSYNGVNLPGSDTALSPGAYNGVTLPN